MKIFKKKTRVRRKLLGTYLYHNIRFNVFWEPDLKHSSIWVEFSDHSYFLYAIENIRKKDVIKQLNTLSEDIVVFMNDNYGDIPMTENEFEEYLSRITPVFVRDKAL